MVMRCSMFWFSGSGLEWLVAITRSSKGMKATQREVFCYRKSLSGWTNSIQSSHHQLFAYYYLGNDSSTLPNAAAFLPATQAILDLAQIIISVYLIRLIETSRSTVEQCISFDRSDHDNSPIQSGPRTRLPIGGRLFLIVCQNLDCLVSR